MKNIKQNTCKAITKKGTPCKNHPIKNSDYCYIHSFGKFKGVTWYKNSTFHFIITIFVAFTIFFIGPSRSNQEKMLENHEKTHTQLDTIDGKLSKVIDKKKDISLKKMTNRGPVNEVSKLVATLEEILSEDQVKIKSPDHIEDGITGELRKVDVSIKKMIGSIPVLIIIECKDDSVLDDTLWIEQIAQKRNAINASKAVAVFNGNLSGNAAQKASNLNIETRLLSEITKDDISDWFKVKYMTQLVYHVDFLSVSFRAEKDKQKLVDNLIKKNSFKKSFNTDENIFLNTSDNEIYSFNHIWRGVLSKKREEIYSGVNPSGEKVRRTIFSSFGNPESRYQIIIDSEPIDILEIRKKCDLWIEEKHIPFDLSQYRTRDDKLVESAGVKIEANGVEYKFNLHKDLKTGQMYISGNNIADVDFNFEQVEKDGPPKSTTNLDLK